MEKMMIDKTGNKKIGRLQEMRITTFIVIISAIVLNILWWAGIRFLSTDNSNNVTINMSSAAAHHAISAE